MSEIIRDRENNFIDILSSTDENTNDSISFGDGTVGACCYSYEIASHGSFELDKAETWALYCMMKTYYEDEARETKGLKK